MSYLRQSHGESLRRLYFTDLPTFVQGHLDDIAVIVVKLKRKLLEITWANL